MLLKITILVALIKLIPSDLAFNWTPALITQVKIKKKFTYHQNAISTKRAVSLWRKKIIFWKNKWNLSSWFFRGKGNRSWNLIFILDFLAWVDHFYYLSKAAKEHLLCLRRYETIICLLRRSILAWKYFANLLYVSLCSFGVVSYLKLISRLSF